MKDFNCESCIHKEVCAGFEVTMPECKHYRPAVDAVEVVRCYQCKYYLKSPMICEHEDGLWTPDKLDYCSFGERWDGE